MKWHGKGGQFRQLTLQLKMYKIKIHLGCFDKTTQMENDCLAFY